LVTKFGSESGSMIRAMAVLGYFLKIATMARSCQYSSPKLYVKILLTVDVLRLVHTQATDGKFSVGCLRSAITARKIVDNQSRDLVTRDVFDAVFDNGNLVTGVARSLIRIQSSATSPSQLTST
jgi:hypothetical protein